MTTEEAAKKSKPIPVPNELTAPFWDAAKEHRLAIQRCRKCGYFNHPPKPLCDKCASEDLAFEAVSGKGKIYSYTFMRQRNVPGFEDDVPYLNVIIELDEQPQLFMITNLRGAGAEQIKIGQRVEVVFEEIAGGLMLPQFKPANR